jgi:serine/threonine protein kinase
MFSKNSNDKSSFKLTQKQIGKGSFGSVFIGETEDGTIAAKCEEKTKNKKSMTLLKEFMICKTFYLIVNYLGLMNSISHLDNEILTNKNPKEDKKISQKIIKNKMKIDNMNVYDEIKIFKSIIDNNMLIMPKEMSMNFMLKYKCVPCILKYIEYNNHNFLLMELCGNNLDSFLEKNRLTERGKYFMAMHLLNIMSCIHRCGVVHRDIKLSNIVLNKNFTKEDNTDEIYPIIIDMGLSEKYYKVKSDKIIKNSVEKNKNIIGTLRYISINIHEYNSPTINDDLISLSYVLVSIMTNNKLPWIGHIKDDDKFKPEKHRMNNCKCGYHKNKKNKTTKENNTIAEMKFHTPLEELTGKYRFLKKWISYLYSLKPNQLPSYTFLHKELATEILHFKKDNEIDDLFFEFESIE